MSVNRVFDLTGRTAFITGAGGLLGPKHAEAIIEFGGNVILTDHHIDRVEAKAAALNEKYNRQCATAYHMDVTDPKSVQAVVDLCDKIDILINNAAKDPKVKKGGGLTPDSRFETMTPEYWNEGVDAAMNGTFYCSQAVANKMLQSGGGVILNVASDLGVIAPDQRLYRKEGIAEEMQNVKPITYSAAKWAIVGMTKYLAVYLADKNYRVNTLSPTGIFNHQNEKFVKNFSNTVPSGRMLNPEEIVTHVAYLTSSDSQFLTGQNIIVDGGRSVW